MAADAGDAREEISEALSQMRDDAELDQLLRPEDRNLNFGGEPSTAFIGNRSRRRELRWRERQKMLRQEREEREERKRQEGDS